MKNNQQIIKESVPIKVSYENNTNEIKKCVLFGVNNIFNENFGSECGVDIKVNDMYNYIDLLSEIVFNDVKILKWVITSDNINWIRDCKISFVEQNILRGIKTQELFELNLHRDAYQNQSDIINFMKPFELAGGNYCEFNIHPKTKIEISFYPSEISGERFEMPKRESQTIVITTSLKSFLKQKYKSVKQKIKSLFE